MEQCYNIINPLSLSQILDTHEAFALTQYLTNIYELFKQVVDEDIEQKLFYLNGSSLAACRNISAHSYDSLDWAKVKIVCKRLCSDEFKQLFNNILKQQQEQYKSDNILQNEKGGSS